METTPSTSLEEALREAHMRLVPENFGPLKDADANARFKGPCGDTMEFWLHVREDRIVNCSFLSDGCSISVYCGATIGRRIQGLAIEDVVRLKEEDFAHILEELGIEETDCIKLALITLKKTVAEYARARCSGDCKSCSVGCDEAGANDSANASETSESDEKREPDESASSETDVAKERQEADAADDHSFPGNGRKNIVVMSGKGGVGKSTVSVGLAWELQQQGFNVGLMDIDFHGPSIPVMLGISSNGLETDNGKLVPMDVNGVKVMSMGFLLPSDDSPVIWRGPMKMGVIKQFIEEVHWGDLDYLIVDCPPGTGDEPLSVCQSLGENTSALIVTTPQEVAASDVRRSVRFCERLKLPVVGIVENMSGFVCTHCGKISNIFGEGGGASTADSYGLTFMGSIPVDSQIRESCDQGTASDLSVLTKAQTTVMNEVTRAIVTRN